MTKRLEEHNTRETKLYTVDRFLSPKANQNVIIHGFSLSTYTSENLDVQSNLKEAKELRNTIFINVGLLTAIYDHIGYLLCTLMVYDLI